MPPERRKSRSMNYTERRSLCAAPFSLYALYILCTNIAHQLLPGYILITTTPVTQPRSLALNSDLVTPPHTPQLSGLLIYQLFYHGAANTGTDSLGQSSN